MWRLAILCTCLMVSVGGDVYAQQFPFSKEIRFARYLMEKEAFKQAEQVLESIDTTRLSTVQLDSLYFERGFFYYGQKKLEKSINNLQSVSKQSGHYTQARFFSSYCMTYTRNYQQALLVLDSLRMYDSTLTETRTFQKAGIALLQRDYAGYAVLKKGFRYSSYALADEEKKLDVHYSQRLLYKHKSPFLGGLYSAIIPGAGKFYAGKKKQGIATFLPVISAAILTLEAYKKDGFSGARFWTSASLFTIFYAGNIWGSSVAVKIRNAELDKAYENKILLDMHIPLRKLYQ